MKVLVTGGNGFIGSVVVRQLVAAGHEVRCLIRAGSNVDRLGEVPFERVTGDIREWDDVSAAVAGCAGVIHLASLSAWDQIESPLMADVVEGGTHNVLDAAQAHPGIRVVFVSSILAINGADEPTPFDESSPWTLPDQRLTYSRFKRRAEALCLAAAADGMHVVIVNPGEVYGPEDTALITACNLVDFGTSKPVLVCSGGTSVVYVDDVALAIVRALERGRSGERYILGGDNLTIAELAALSLELLGKRTCIIKIPNPVIKAITAVATRLNIPLPFNKHVIPYATKYWFMSNAKAKRELGVQFRSARDTLAPTIAWLKTTGRIA